MAAVGVDMLVGPFMDDMGWVHWSTACRYMALFCRADLPVAHPSGTATQRCVRSKPRPPRATARAPPTWTVGALRVSGPLRSLDNSEVALRDRHFRRHLGVWPPRSRRLQRTLPGQSAGRKCFQKAGMGLKIGQKTATGTSRCFEETTPAVLESGETQSGGFPWETKRSQLWEAEDLPKAIRWK